MGMKAKSDREKGREEARKRQGKKRKMEVARGRKKLELMMLDNDEEGLQQKKETKNERSTSYKIKNCKGECGATETFEAFDVEVEELTHF